MSFLLLRMPLEKLNLVTTWCAPSLKVFPKNVADLRTTCNWKEPSQSPVDTRWLLDNIKIAGCEFKSSYMRPLTTVQWANAQIDGDALKDYNRLGATQTITWLVLSGLYRASQEFTSYVGDIKIGLDQDEKATWDITIHELSLDDGYT
ncbi:predicted protein [Lichtheimia corymbifera JMRC:FSU:9682]|uniref:Uncharacterized protein n=1 Tax=Lichtheimia corymbifera JMRC:FSU:9682 TaxID=1263082 RepID=A0A068RLN2_9FUNG|nr:predicted protein [Lichtheimia corymbifera JMRC:FSU:9682]